MRVALAQLDSKPLAARSNATSGAAAIARAARSGADLVILPELMSSGYVVERIPLMGVAERIDAPGPALTAWQEAAARHGIAVVAGFAELDPDGILFNSAAAWDSCGRLAGVYRKLHLFHLERQAFAPGNNGLPVFELDGVRVGLLICYDLRFPEALRVLALQEAQVVATPSAWVSLFDARPPEPDETIGQVDAARVQANLSQVFVAVADRIGMADGVSFLGRSVLVNPYGKVVLGPLDGTREGVVCGDIDLHDVDRARRRAETIRPREERREDVYGALLGYTIREPVTPVASASPTTEQALDNVEIAPGYLVDLDRALARADPEFLTHCKSLLDAAYLRDGSLTHREKELVYVAALTAMGSSRDQILPHVDAAIKAGAKPRELLEVLEQLLPTCGVRRLMEGLEAWREVCAAQLDDQRVR